MSKDQNNASLPPGVRDNVHFMEVPKSRVIRPDAAQLTLRSTPPLVLRVTTKEQLVEALRSENTIQVVIAEKKLAQPFDWVLLAQEARNGAGRSRLSWQVWPVAKSFWRTPEMLQSSFYGMFASKAGT
jgi:hypothetical protein